MATTPLPRPPKVPIPPPPEPENEVFRLVLQGTLYEQTTVNVFHYQSDEPLNSATSATFQELYTLFAAAGGVLPLYLAAVSSEWHGVAIVIDSPTKTILAREIFFIDTSVGLGPPEVLPNHTAVVIRKTSDWRGKMGRGRISVPAIPAVDVTGPYVANAATFNALAVKMGQVLQGVTRAFKPVIFGRHIIPTADPKITQWVNHVIPVRVCSTDQTLGTVRRRKPGVGQ